MKYVGSLYYIHESWFKLREGECCFQCFLTGSTLNRRLHFLNFIFHSRTQYTNTHYKAYAFNNLCCFILQERDAYTLGCE